jgi:nucleoside-diphosphate-sugar epimerase
MKDDRADNQAFTVGTGKGTTILEFVSTLAALYGKSVSPIVGEKFRPADSRHMVADISKLQQIGYQPRVSLAEGLKRYSTWILEGPRAEDSFSAALQSLETMRIVRSTRS